MGNEFKKVQSHDLSHTKESSMKESDAVYKSLRYILPDSITFTLHAINLKTVCMQTRKSEIIGKI